MRSRLEKRLDKIAVQKPGPLNIVINCFCGECEPMPWPPTKPPVVTHTGPDGEEIRVYDNCPLAKHY